MQLALGLFAEFKAGMAHTVQILF